MPRSTNRASPSASRTKPSDGLERLHQFSHCSRAIDARHCGLPARGQSSLNRLAFPTSAGWFTHLLTSHESKKYVRPAPASTSTPGTCTFRRARNLKKRPEMFWPGNRCQRNGAAEDPHARQIIYERSFDRLMIWLRRARWPATRFGPAGRPPVFGAVDGPLTRHFCSSCVCRRIPLTPRERLYPNCTLV